MMWNYNRYKYFIILILLCPIVSANQVLRLNVVSTPLWHTEEQTGFLDEVVIEMFKAIDHRLETVVYPAERGLMNANTGVVDGEMIRVNGIDKQYTNLIRVPEMLIDSKFVIFSRQPIDVRAGWKSLDNKTVAFINGWKILEKNVPKSAEITKVIDVFQLFKLIETGRTDYIIYLQLSGLYLIKKLKIKGVEIRQPPLARMELFMYLHKKHKLLVPRLASALKKMKQDGRYQRLINKHQLPFLAK